MPMKLSNIPNFERKNPGLAINVLSWTSKSNDVGNREENELVMKHPNLDIIHKSRVEDGEKIYLILLEEKDNYHYTAVTDLDKLMNRDNKGKSTRIQSAWCSNCLNGFRNKTALETHEEICKTVQTGTLLII